VRSEQNEIGNLQKGWEIEIVNADKGCGGARDEDTDLVNGVVGAVEGAIFVEWGGLEGKEERGGDALVDGVLGDVDEEKREHAVGC
jgi:hypothetical protein